MSSPHTKNQVLNIYFSLYVLLTVHLYIIL